MSQSMRDTTMNVFEPRSMSNRKSEAPWPAPAVVRKKFSAAVCSSPATAMPRRIGSPAKTTGRRDSPRIAPLLPKNIPSRARNTVQMLPRAVRGPGGARPRPRATVSPATRRLLLPEDPRVDAQRAPRLRDEHVLEGDLLRLDELNRRAVSGRGLADLGEHRDGGAGA